MVYTRPHIHAENKIQRFPSSCCSTELLILTNSVRMHRTFEVWYWKGSLVFSQLVFILITSSFLYWSVFATRRNNPEDQNRHRHFHTTVRTSNLTAQLVHLFRRIAAVRQNFVSLHTCSLQYYNWFEISVGNFETSTSFVLKCRCSLSFDRFGHLNLIFSNTRVNVLVIFLKPLATNPTQRRAELEWRSTMTLNQSKYVANWSVECALAGDKCVGNNSGHELN
jgi:hypothetical protein